MENCTPVRTDLLLFAIWQQLPFPHICPSNDNLLLLSFYAIRTEFQLLGSHFVLWLWIHKGDHCRSNFKTWHIQLIWVPCCFHIRFRYENGILLLIKDQGKKMQNITPFLNVIKKCNMKEDRATSLFFFFVFVFSFHWGTCENLVNADTLICAKLQVWNFVN